MNCSRRPTPLAAEAERRILKRIEMITADGAANEQVALKMLHPSSARTSPVKLGASCRA